MAKKPTKPTAKGKSSRRSRKKVAKKREYYVPTKNRKGKLSLPMQFTDLQGKTHTISVTVDTSKYGMVTAARLLQPAFSAVCEARFYQGDREALVDLVAALGPLVFRKDWVFEVLCLDWDIANGREPPSEVLEGMTAQNRDKVLPGNVTKPQRKRARLLLKAVGKALATTGQGQAPNLARDKTLAREYHELLSKVQRMAKPARRFAEYDPAELQLEQYDNLREKFVERYGLPIKDVDLLVEYLAGSTPMTPSKATAELVAGHHKVSARTVQQAAARYPRH